jgi:hypothetical protein
VSTDRQISNHVVSITEIRTSQATSPRGHVEFLASVRSHYISCTAAGRVPAYATAVE